MENPFKKAVEESSEETKETVETSDATEDQAVQEEHTDETITEEKNEWQEKYETLIISI